MRMLFIGFGVGVAVGAGGCYLYLSAVKQPELRRGGRAITLDENHHALKFGAPETEIVRQYEGYIAAYDYRTRNPKWVLEHITRDSSSGDAKRDGSEFFPDPGVEPRFSAKLSDFRGSGYDRGHMAPAADFKSSQKAMDETFSLVNISPQVGAGFNRDYWARFERFVKELTYASSDVYVMTGPLWLPTRSQLEDEDGGGGGGGGKGKGGKWTLVHDWIGKPPGLVAVPTHYYKVVVADPRGGGEPGKAPARDAVSPLAKGAVAVGAFVMPNQPMDARSPLSAYVVPLEDLEQVAGTRFFPDLLGEPRRRAALDTAAAGWRQEGLAQLKPFERLSMKQALAALPAPGSGAADVETSTVSTAKGASSSSSSPSRPAPPPAPKTPEGAGVVHICDVNACQLPRVDWYLPNGSGAGNGGSGGKRRAAA
ncbi:hypothetical protein PLESTB_000280700 [Pleodorina starrii]|uniref:Endonuclease n=1 Tax=Pleodorina starrii TaxID=330485 RepID=A0A9W6BDS3_9CHLO|nr:hypothetical protein PLESTM_001408600 [Pleodorina starrii]GLC49732.1 hypothetical protein PLESTB_000280700 [Pleodorina starrii]GLC76035.1 hypothetical protein PLESTF_001722800 [Pleodorina starrii]